MFQFKNDRIIFVTFSISQGVTALFGANIKSFVIPLLSCTRACDWKQVYANSALIININTEIVPKQEKKSRVDMQKSIPNDFILSFHFKNSKKHPQNSSSLS